MGLKAAFTENTAYAVTALILHLALFSVLTQKKKPKQTKKNTSSNILLLMIMLSGEHFRNKV